MTPSTRPNGRGRKRTGVRLSSAHAALLRAYFIALARTAPRVAERQAAALFCFPRRLKHRDAPRIPAAARSRIVGLGPKRIAAWTWGAGPRVLLAHGWEGTARDMVPMASALARRGCRVTIFDMPAHGRSTGMTTTLPEMARALAAVAHATGTPDALVGHSLGAAAAVLAMRDELEASSAALIAPVAEPWLFLRRLAELLAFSAERYDGLIARVEERAGMPVRAIDGVAAARMLTARAMILHDPADRQVPFAQAEALATAWRGAMLHAMPGLGHRRPLFDPGAIERVIEHIAPTGHAETNPEAFG
ncbi:MAG TPA: alpha/beta fold hydrolase [Gemmatimonadaceae bacterium]|nr:alpha/beta fold hydrolase [Gemmatimonadaceae bacterium]